MLMLDEKEKTVLNFLNANSVSGTYALIEVEAIKNSLETPMEAAEILKAFYALERLEYIKIKYDDGMRLCVMSTARGRNYLSGVELAESALSLAKSDFNSAKENLLKTAEKAEAALGELSAEKAKTEIRLNDYAKKNFGFTVAFSFIGGFSGAVLAAAVIALLML